MPPKSYNPFVGTRAVSRRPNMEGREARGESPLDYEPSTIAQGFSPLVDFDDGVRGPRPTDIVHINEQADVMDASDFRLVSRIELGSFLFGTIALVGQTVGPPSFAQDRTLHIEQRTYIYVAGGRYIVSELALGDRGDLLSPGPAFIRFTQDTMPDSIEIHARARRGGIASTGRTDAQEVATLSITGRFLRKGAVTR